MKKLSFVIPCYRSEKTVGDVVNRIIQTVEKDGRYDYEIVCVNDYSPDDTYQVLTRLAAGNARIKVVNLSRNFGQHSALMAGFNYVTGDTVVCLDDDGQNPPEEMFKLIDKLDEGYDLVSAKYTKKNHALYRRLGTKLSFAMASYLIGKPKDIELNSYYAFRRYVVNEVIKYRNAYPFVHGLVLRITRNMANVEITHNERTEGRSGYTLKKLIALWMNGFTAFSEKPLRLSSMVGALAAVFGILYGLFIVIRKIVRPDVLVGYSSMMAVMLFLSGIIMLLLGLLGEYVGRIYISINNAPQYAVKETLNITEDEEKRHEKETADSERQLL